MIEIKEDLKYSDYEIREHRKSRIDPSKMLSIVTGIKCPHCKVRNAELEHLQARACHHCGLWMIRAGNSLECTLKMEG